MFYKFYQNSAKKRTSLTQARKIRISHTRRILGSRPNIFQNMLIHLSLIGFVRLYTHLQFTKQTTRKSLRLATKRKDKVYLWIWNRKINKKYFLYFLLWSSRGEAEYPGLKAASLRWSLEAIRKDVNDVSPCSSFLSLNEMAGIFGSNDFLASRTNGIVLS